MMRITATLADAIALQADDDTKANLPSPPSLGNPPTNYCPRCERTDALVMLPRWHCDACGWRGEDAGQGCTVHIADVVTADGKTSYDAPTVTQQEIDAAKLAPLATRTARQAILARATVAEVAKEIEP